ncbi:uncharacterized protein SETTUDRAFT_161884 [Exserohilum turcica Et28A]|uniref:Uncharacterized protein n=1 Tax=Exserohilum turcicum (strain 28A) TaxID=671987 RepID=R0KBF2_EXST2|nr:uncharacterized protein SETTUDRAFT_161884 [Exserohilum turcica Et28A]EOA85557.1 hypothetical protein SETTUDRAFT_161884 [Exserohilum turcica Et28A]
MITIPLNFTWDWKLNIIEHAHAKNVTNPSTGTLPPSQIRGHMFHGPPGQPEVYVYGGTTFMGNQSFEAYAWPDSSAYPLWSYTYQESYPWGQYAKDTEWMPNHGAGAEAIDQGLAFYLNGQIDWGTSSTTLDSFPKTEAIYVPLQGMVIIDLNTQSGKNISTTKLRDGTPRVGGTMEYLPSVGSRGVLIALGGQIQPSLASPFANVSAGSLIDFGTVDVFDINSYLQNPDSNGTWYSQKTNGEIPAPRIDFCTVAISSADNSSHHIYLYGGVDPITNTAYDDVLILTLPSFTWTNVWPLGEAPRWGHNCHVAGRRQMITVGGNKTNGLTCDWEIKGVAVWEMSTLTWGSVFMINLSNFEVPQKLLSVTGGNAHGNATKKDPALGWTDERLKTVFATPRKYTLSGNTTTTGNSQGKSHTGAIAGGVVGGVAGLSLIAVAALFLHRRHRKRHGPHELENSPIGASPEGEKHKYELQVVNENSPAELFGDELKELETPRQAVEADHLPSTRRAELPGTNTAPGGLHGVPIIRTPGDELPERPEYVAGLRRPSQESTSAAGVQNEEGGQSETVQPHSGGQIHVENQESSDDKAAR